MMMGGDNSDPSHIPNTSKVRRIGLWNSCLVEPVSDWAFLGDDGCPEQTKKGGFCIRVFTVPLKGAAVVLLHSLKGHFENHLLRIPEKISSSRTFTIESLDDRRSAQLWKFGSLPTQNVSET
jgi:hypothetical protein